MQVCKPVLCLFNAHILGVYINSLALQAVLDDWTANRGQQHPHHGSSDAQTFVGSYKKNEHYIKEVIDASRNLLRQVVTGLFPNDNLKHAPVRTHMRILSGAMFLLKVGITLSSFLSNDDRLLPWERRKTKSQPPYVYSMKPSKPSAPV